MKTAYITDSGTGNAPSIYTFEGIISLPLQIIDNDISYDDMENINKKECIDLLKQQHVLKTSQPIYGKIYDTIKKLKEDGIEIIFAVPICRGLSGTMSTLESVCSEFNIKLVCFDTYVTCIVQDYLIKRIKQLNENNTPLETIDEIFNNVIESTNTILIPNDLKHLKRGGRLTPLAYGIAEILKIIPILKINKSTDGKIDVLSKVRTYKNAWNKTLSIMEEEIKTEDYLITIAHVDALDKAKQCEISLKETFPNCKIQIVELCNVVAAHTGLDCIAIQYFREL